MFRGLYAGMMQQFVRESGGLLRPLSLIVGVLLCSAGLSAQTVLVGNQTVEANLDSNATGLAEAFPATATTSGQVGSINFFLDESSASTKVYLGIYTDANGHPGSLLTQGSTTQLARGTWNGAIVNPISISSGASYWIAILGTTGGKPYFRDRSTTSCHSQTSSQSNLTSLPTTWTTGQTWNTCYISAYAVSNTLPATALLGNQAIETYLDKNPAGRAEAFPATANSTGSVGVIALYLDPTSGSGPVNVGLYADNNGHPGTLLGQGSTSSAVAGSWNQISISASSITAGHPYWIAVLGTQATSPYFRDRQTTVCHSETTPQSNLTTLSATWSTGSTWNTCYISAYGLPAAGSPVLSLSTQSFSFSAIQGGANPSAQSVSVTNTGAGTLSFTAASDAGWLSVSPASGTAPQTLQVSASIGSLVAGTYTGHVTVAAAGAQGSPSVVTVTLTVAPAVPPAVLSLSTQSLSFSGTQGGTSPSPQSVSVTNTGGGTLSFTAASDSTWLSVSPANGTAPQTLQVSVSIGSLVAGTYTGHVTVTAAGAQGSPSVVTVTLTVAPAVPPAVLSLSTQSLSFSAIQGGANPSAQSVGVTNTGGGTLSFTAASDSAWLSVSPASGTAPQTLQVSASIGSLTAGTYTGHVTVTAAGAQGSSSVVTVTLTVAAAVPPAVLSVSPSGLSLSATQGGANPSAQSVSVTNTGGGTLSFTAASDSGWLSVSPASGTAPQTLQVSASLGSLTAGTYTGHVTVTATGAQGSPSIVSVTLVVVLPGVVVGQVLSDVTGLPLKGATVQVEGGTNQTSTDDSGAYSIPVTNSHFFMSIGIAPSPDTGSPGTVTVEREIFVQSGVGTIPVDARLTAVAAPTLISTTGGSLTGGSVTIVVPPGAVASATKFYLTSLSQQGLPALLPLGWSPLLAFDLRSDASTGATFNANFMQLPNALSVHLVEYSYSTHVWNMVTPNLSAANGALSIPIPSVGSYALVTADAGSASIAIPSAGNPLTGVAMVVLPTGVTASGTLNPPSIPPTGGTSMATLTIQSPVPLPSGTVIQANVLETYSLVSGKKLSDAARTEDLLVYQYSAPAGTAAVASFPVTPSQIFKLGQVSSGDVHLDILSGRESVRGQVAGTAGVTVTGGDATLSLAAGALTQTTAAAVNPESTDSFLPSTPQLIPLAEYNIDLSGLTLTVPAQLTVAAGTAKPGDNIFLVQIVRIQGAPYLVAVSGAQVTGSNLVTQAPAGLSGIVQGGDYVFYKVTAATGLVAGIVSSSSGPISALVQTDSLPFSTFTPASGSYVIPALAGQVNLTAAVLNTAVSGTTSIPLTAGQTATANITVVGQVESATVTPANGSVGISLTPEIDITAADAFSTVNSAITASNFALNQIVQGTGTPVPIRFVVSPESTRIAVFPQSALQPSTTYTFAATGLTNVLGGITSVPAVSFTTQAITPPNFNTNALVFAMPDQNGNTQISAPANSFPPGTTILIVDQTNGVVLSLTVANDGSVTGQMPATIDDVLAVTITAPDKTTATFARSQFVAPDGTTAVGPGGGTVSGPGNTGLIIQGGTLNRGTTFKLTPLDQSAFPQLPGWPGLMFGSGLHVDAPAMPTFNKEVKVAFPVPAGAPTNAFYYVYRRITDQNGKVYFETIDHAFVQGTGASAQVVTASPPFCGYHNPTGNFNIAAAASFTGTPQFSPFQDFILMFDIAQPVAGLPGIGSPGLIVGIVQQTVPPGPGQLFTSYKPYVNNVIVSLDSDPSQVATYNGQCSTFTIFDPRLGGGTRTLTATDGTNTIHATADEVNGIQVDDATYAIYLGLENQYRNIGRVNFTFPPSIPPPAPPRINIAIANAADGKPISGILQTGTNLNITFSSNLTVIGATINGATFSVSPLTANVPADGLNHYRLSDPNYPYNVGGTPGLNTIVASAVDPLNPDVPVNASRSFLVVAAGGSNTIATACTVSVQNCTSPMILAGTTPENNATAVPPNVFPQITFSEPVTHVPGNVTLVDHLGTPVLMSLIGVKADGTVADPVQPSDAITSLTLQPLQGLKFNETYKLALNAKNTAGCIDSNGNVNTAATAVLIVDQNQPPNGPLCLPPFPLPGGPPYQFTTFGPQELGGTKDQFGATRPVIIGKRAFLGTRPSPETGGLEQVDITDPSNPMDLGVLGPTSFIGLPLDIAGQTSSPVTGGALVAIASGQPPIENILPSNVWLYDVSDPDHPARVGAVSATTSTTQDGTVLRLFMKDQFLYTSTFLKGLEVIDLQQAVAEYQSVFSSDPTQFGQAVTTEGNGFATDTVVNTIPLYVTNFSATMYDLKAADYVTGPPPAPNVPPPTQTLVLATGRVPLVIADPQKPGPNGVLYPPVDTSNPTVSSNLPGAGLPNLDASPLLFQMQNADGTSATYQFQSGRALALGTLALTDSQGNSTPQQVAVLVGGGTAPTLPDGSTPQGVLAVVALALNPNDPLHPLQPVVKGLVGLSAPPVDVVLHGNLALISTDANKILLVNLEDPTHPANAGEIDASAGSIFGDRLAVTDDGIVITSSFGANLGGVHTTALVPGIFTTCNGPVLAKLISPPSAATPVFQTVQDSICSVRVLPADTPVANGSFTFTPGAGLPATMPIALPNDAAVTTIAAGQQIVGNTFAVQSNAIDTRTGSAIPSFQQNVAVGTVQLVMDYNNDTIVDDTTDLPLKSTNKVGFWASDQTITGLPPRERLLDYLTVRVKSSVPWQAGTIQLQLKSNFADEWFIADKLKPGDSYLQSEADSTAQDAWVGQPCQLSANHAQNFGGECVKVSLQSQKDANNYNPQPLPNLTLGDNDYLFRCEQCPRQYPNVSAIADRTLQLVAFNRDGSIVVLDQASLDMRLLKEWATVYTVRSTPNPQNPDDFRPNAQAQLGPGWEDVPADADKITALVHGFHTSEDSAEKKFIPVMMKRLYWAGHPVLDTGQNDHQGHAHVVGFAWPGDEQFSGIANQSLFFFPEDEMHALESGVPIAKKLADIKNGGAGRTINIIAHSLGNMVVNSAISRPEITPGVIKNYIMYDAAVPAEVFGPMFPSQPSLLTHAQFLGYDPVFANRDARWITEFQDVLAGVPHIIDPQTLVDLGPDFTDRDHWCALLNDPNNFAALKPKYNFRWLQTRPPGGIADEALAMNAAAPPCNVPDDLPQRGPWQGFFAGNLNKANMINAFNTGDSIVQYVWRLMQFEQKPNYASKGVELVTTVASLPVLLTGTLDPSVNLLKIFPLEANDSRALALWGDLPLTTPAENSVFADGSTHSNIIRQWAELSQWYPSLTDSIGVINNFATATGKTQNDDVDLTPYGNSNNVGFGVKTHSFLYEAPFSRVQPAFTLFKSRLQ